MPIIFRVTCSSCKYHLDFPDALMIVLDDEGIEHNCIHPFEKSIAEGITGKSSDVLSESGQSYWGNPLLCNSCGEISYYSDTTIDRLDLQLNNSHVTKISCKKCNQSNLYLPFPSSEIPESLFPFRNNYGSQNNRLFILATTIYILSAMWFVSFLKLSIVWSIILLVFIVFVIPICYLWLRYRLDTRMERRYWKTIPCPQCQKRKLSFSVSGMS